jgi:hypothetical protein
MSSYTVETINGPIVCTQKTTSIGCYIYQWIDSEGNHHFKRFSFRSGAPYRDIERNELLITISRLKGIIYDKYNYTQFIDFTVLLHLMSSAKKLMTIETIRSLIGTSEELYLIQNHRSFQRQIMSYLKDFYSENKKKVKV